MAEETIDSVRAERDMLLEKHLTLQRLALNEQAMRQHYEQQLEVSAKRGLPTDEQIDLLLALQDSRKDATPSVRRRDVRMWLYRCSFENNCSGPSAGEQLDW